MPQNLSLKKVSIKQNSPKKGSRRMPSSPERSGEPRTNGLKVQCSPFMHAGFTGHVYQYVTSKIDFVI